MKQLPFIHIVHFHIHKHLKYENTKIEIKKNFVWVNYTIICKSGIFQKCVQYYQI